MTQGDNDDKAVRDAATDAPEVEVEVVEATPGAETAELLEAADDAASIDAADEVAPAKTMTPGVILFLVFMATTTALFVLWRVQGAGAPASASADRAGGFISAFAQTPPTQAPLADDDAADISEKSAPLEEQEAASEETTNEAESDNVLAESVSDDVASEDASAQPSASEAAADLFAADPQAVTDASEDLQPEESTDAADDNEEDRTETSAADVDDMPLTEEASPVEDVVETDGAVSEAATEAVSESVETVTAAAPQELIDENAALRAEVARLTAALEATQKNVDDRDAEMAALREQFTAALQTRTEEATAAMDEMRARFETAIRNQRAANPQTLETSRALLALRQAAAKGAPFIEELDALAALAPSLANAPDMDALRARAREGAPTIAALKKTFTGAAVEALSAAGRENATTFLGKGMAQLKSFISVRPATPQPGDTARAIISRAEAALNNDDIAGAVAELGALTGEARKAMDAWLGEAAAHARIRAYVDAINAALVQ
ncbi:MAG: mitofilin family membrane protein [Pseudomonadota bacterium]